MVDTSAQTKTVVHQLGIEDTKSNKTRPATPLLNHEKTPANRARAHNQLFSDQTWHSELSVDAVREISSRTHRKPQKFPGDRI